MNRWGTAQPTLCFGKDHSGYTHVERQVHVQEGNQSLDEAEDMEMERSPHVINDRWSRCCQCPAWICAADLGGPLSLVPNLPRALASIIQKVFLSLCAAGRESCRIHSWGVIPT